MFISVNIKIMVLWNVMLCSPIDWYYLRGIFCLPFQVFNPEDEGKMFFGNTWIGGWVSSRAGLDTIHPSIHPSILLGTGLSKKGSSGLLYP
jgi:hypothetical protein